MKQLKVIVNSYNVNNGYIDVNFNQSIDINPYSSIALDKISLQILPNASGTIVVQEDQTINIVTQNRGARLSPVRSVVLPAGKYTYNQTTPFVPSNSTVSALPDIITTLNNLFNGILNGTPLLSSNIPGGTELDYGLGFKWIGQLTTDNPPVYKVTIDSYQDNFGGGTSTAAGPPPTLIGDIIVTGPIDPQTNLVTTIGRNNSKGTGFKTTGVQGAYGLIDSYPIISGCFQGFIRLTLGDVSNNSHFDYGLALATESTTLPVIKYGLTFVNDMVFILNNGLPIAIASDINFFKGAGTVNVYIYTDSTNGNLRMCVENPSGVIAYTTPVGSYTGYDFNTPYYMAVSGYNGPGMGLSNYFTNFSAFHQPNIQVDNNGIYYKIPERQLYLTTDNSIIGAKTPNRQIQIDLTSSPLLIKGLGFSLNIIQGAVSDTSTFSYTGPKGIDFANYYDLGLQLLNINLETYVGFTNGQKCGKNNTLAYFLAQRIADSSDLFHYESKQMMFLSIENKEKLNISSLQFRVYDINTLLAVNLTSASFNIFITNEHVDDSNTGSMQKRVMSNMHY